MKIVYESKQTYDYSVRSCMCFICYSTYMYKTMNVRKQINVNGFHSVCDKYV
jgi:hypothetical protein